VSGARAHENGSISSGDRRPDASLLTAEDLSLRWSVPKSHVYRLARSGRLPTVRLGRYMRWRLEVVEEWERDGGTDRVSVATSHGERDRASRVPRGVPR